MGATSGESLGEEFHWGFCPKPKTRSEDREFELFIKELISVSVLEGGSEICRPSFRSVCLLCFLGFWLILAIQTRRQ